jgi:nitrate/nitrite transporter NarK
MSSTGNGTHGNIITGGLLTATGNITGGNITTGGLITATGNITGGNLITGGLLSVTGNATVGNLTTSGGSGGNISNANVISANTFNGTTLSITGNATVGNLTTSGGAGGNISNVNAISANTFSASGTITGGNYSGTNIGALGAPLIVPWVAVTWGWEWAFIITGGIGFVWVVWWAIAYHTPREHPTITQAELAHIESDPPDEQGKVSWFSLFKFRQTWAFAIGKFMTDPVWWLYLFWIPGFLQKQHGVDLKNIGLPLVVIYLIADVGSIGGGWLSGRLIKAGWSVNAARKTAMGICAVCVIPIVFVNDVGMWPAVLLVSLAAAAHQGWSANIFTLASDMFPRKAVGSVVGIGGMAGAVGGMLLALVVGEVLHRTGSYAILWFIAGSAYLIGLLIIHVLVPRLEPVKMEDIAEAEAK